jgi:Domain of unknown function (DUF4252)
MLRLRINSLAPLLLIAGYLPLWAQTAQPSGPPAGWVPPSVEVLGQHAAFHTSFTFDRAMLHFAGNFMDSGDQDTQRAVNKLDAITVHSFHFTGPGFYDPAALAAVRADYEATGWKHMVTAHHKGDPFSSGETDLWISLVHAEVTGMTVLLVDPKDIEVITITGDLSPLDLLHLRGHFGIPKFDADHFTPAPETGRKAYSRPPEETQPAPPPPNQ